MSKILDSLSTLAPILDVAVIGLGVVEVLTSHPVEGAALTLAGLSLLAKSEGQS